MSANINLIQAVNLALDDALASDPNVMVFGESVSPLLKRTPASTPSPSLAK